MKKNDYIAPSVRVVAGCALSRHIICVSGGSWDDSIQNAGSDWGGTDIDESDFGL